MLTTLILCLLALAGPSIDAYGASLDYGSVNAEATDLSILELLADGEAHDGSTVRVMGVLQIELEGDQLCLSKEALRYSVTRNCLALGVDPEPLVTSREELAEANGEYVLVEGVFRASDRGHLSLFSGAIREVTRILLWERAQDFRVSENRWQELVEEGEAHLSRGAHRRALELFEEADRLDLFEVPNYKALHRIAEARCLLGEVGEGPELLEEFRCMLAVDRGELPCYVGPETRTAPGERNPALSELCYERMCSEMYLSYYDSPSEAALRELDRLAQEAEGVEAVCRALAEPTQVEPVRNASFRRP